MSLTKEVIDKILSLGEVEIFEREGGRNYTSKQIYPMEDPCFPVLAVNTLRGLVDYLKSGFDEKEIGALPDPDSQGTGVEQSLLAVALHIISPTEVHAFLPVSGPWKERDTVIVAQWDQRLFPFGDWLTQEDFVIKMQAMFQESESWQPVMGIAGKIICEDKTEMVDNGVAQAVTMHRGAVKSSGIILPNPVLLRPVRTFTEVEQPESKFVFRMQSDPVRLALYEADMGAWKMVAKENIRKFLMEELPGIPVIM